MRIISGISINESNYDEPFLRKPGMKDRIMIFPKLAFSFESSILFANCTQNCI